MGFPSSWCLREAASSGCSAAEELLKQAAPFVVLRLARLVQRAAKIARPFARRGELRIERVVQLAGQHLFALGTQYVNPAASSR